MFGIPLTAKAAFTCLPRSIQSIVQLKREDQMAVVIQCSPIILCGGRLSACEKKNFHWPTSQSLSYLIIKTTCILYTCYVNPAVYTVYLLLFLHDWLCSYTLQLLFKPVRGSMDQSFKPVRGSMDQSFKPVRGSIDQSFN